MQRGISDTAVRKTLQQGHITVEPDGTIDVERADCGWSSNTAKPQTKQLAKTKPVPAAAVICISKDKLIALWITLLLTSVPI